MTASDGYDNLNQDDTEGLPRRTYTEETSTPKEKKVNKKMDKEVGMSKKQYLRVVPIRSWVLSMVSFFALILTVVFQRIVFLAPANPNRSVLFIYQTLSSTFSWVFVVAGAGALFTFLAHVQAKETVMRFTIARYIKKADVK